MAKPRVGVTVGDPAGIGPEISLKAAADPAVLDVCEPILYGPHHETDLRGFVPGVVSADAGRAACEAIARAVEDVRLGRIDAIATAPINKEAFARAEIPYKGHTDLLAMLTRSGPAVMMFHSEPLRVVLATVHVALRDVPQLLTPELLDFIIGTTARELPRFGSANPRIALAGLNPHAGEHGVIGDEDDAVLRPAVERARRERGIDISGPWPGDTVFSRAARGEFDAVIACYHDQGLIPVKLLAFGRAVNVTLGLPLIRTSVDHGTAFDIAGQGVADPASLVAAIRLAARLATSPGPKP
jgi:4-phospho-D-threonate 3-dehydrogenase / 4-phospho-D-erythronate 3-dehydrogenase